MFSKDYSIVVPFYNEEENIRPMLEKELGPLKDIGAQLPVATE